MQPPIFHCPHLSKRVDRHSVENLPLGMFGHAAYKAASSDCGPGDVLAIVTDGLVEVFDRQEGEIGPECIEKILVEAAAEPLRAVAQRIMETSAAFGKITDHRTVLLVRRLIQPVSTALILTRPQTAPHNLLATDIAN
jgi:serine phosphatase RsbU (regulator of sigma subunit)